MTEAVRNGAEVRCGWGPFTPGISPDEAKARLRVVRALARVLCGPRSVELRTAILLAVIDLTPHSLAAAQTAFAQLGTRDQRAILCCYAAEC